MERRALQQRSRRALQQRSRRASLFEEQSQVEEEERTNEKREKGQGKRKGENKWIRKRGTKSEEEEKRESNYYKWQSLSGAYDKGLSALPGTEIPQ